MFKRSFTHGNHVIPVALPKNPDESQGGSHSIHSNILNDVRFLFTNIEGRVLKPGMKFCRNYAKSSKESRKKQIRVLEIRPEGSPIFHDSIAAEDLYLKHSIFIHKTPEQLKSSQTSNTALVDDGADNLGVWLLCESTSDDKIGIGYRNRHRRIDTQDKWLVANCVVKYMLYLGTVADFRKTTELNFTPFENPRWAVYKRRVHNYIFVHKGKASESRRRGIFISKSGEETIIRWAQNGATLEKLIKNDAINEKPALKEFWSSNKVQSAHPDVLTEIKSIAGITGESDLSTFEVMPYLGPSLYDIAADSKVTLFEKITMCIAFFEHIASEYEGYREKNPEPSTLGFYDIKPDNFSFDIHGTKECVQNDTKAKNRQPTMHTKRYTAPWVCGSLNKQKSIPARDLYAMGKSVMEILELHQNKKRQNNSERLEPLQILFLKKMANDIMSRATANQDNKNLDNAAYIRETIIPSLQDASVSDNILFSSAVNYLREKHALIDDEKKKAIKADKKKKNIFTCAVFGAKAYLDQHQMKNDKTTGKDAVNNFLKDLVSIDSILDTTSYKKAVEDKIETSKKGSNSFSKRSRHNIFNAYSPPTIFAGQKNLTDHIREATEERIYNLGTRDDAVFYRTMNIFLSNDNQNLRFKVLEKAIQYLECSEAGWLGKKAVRGLIKTLSQSEAIEDECIIKEVDLTVNACVFFKGINKTRTAFFGDFLSPNNNEQEQPQPTSCCRA